MKTQARKLNCILIHGSLRQVKVDELIKEVNNFSGESLDTKQEKHSEIQGHILNGRSCWEFKPYGKELSDSLAYNLRRKFSENPFDLINIVYKELQEL